MKCIPVLFLCAGMLRAADIPSDTILLQKARAAMASNLDRLPNYTCLQTIERTERRKSTGKPRLIDIIRIEVALVDGKEMFAWPGSRNFSDADLRTFAPGGAIGNGMFGLFAKAVFQTPIPRFTYAGETTFNGRRAHKWNYVVSVLQSGYIIRVSEEQAVVGYHGSIVVDADSLDLLAMEVSGDDIPPRLDVADARVSVEYQRMPIGAESFLLPTTATLEMASLKGSASINRTKFSGCKQYSGESTISFEDPAPETIAAGPARVLRAPEGLGIELQLVTPVAFEQAAVGDPVTAHLTRPLKLPDGTVLPKKALVHGRLLTFRQQNMGRQSAYVVGLRFFEIESGNTRVQFSATLEDIQTALPGYRLNSTFRPGLRHPEDESVLGSVFFVQASVGRLTPGLRMVWRTKPLQPEDVQ